MSMYHDDSGCICIVVRVYMDLPDHWCLDRAAFLAKAKARTGAKGLADSKPTLVRWLACTFVAQRCAQLRSFRDYIVITPLTLLTILDQQRDLKAYRLSARRDPLEGLSPLQWYRFALSQNIGDNPADFPSNNETARKGKIGTTSKRMHAHPAWKWLQLGLRNCGQTGSQPTSAHICKHRQHLPTSTQVYPLTSIHICPHLPTL